MEKIYQWLADTLGYTHPLHPTLTYIPIGLVIGAFVFGIFALLLRESKYAVTARHCITLAFLGVFPTILLGYMDWQHHYGGAWLFEIRMKIILAISLTLLLLAAVLMHRKWRPGAAPILFVYLLAFLNVVALGYFGGELVFGKGTGHQHAHSKEQAQTGAEQTASESRAKTQGNVSYADVAPIFEQNCVMCHQGESAPENLQMTSYEQIMQGAGDEPVVIAGKPEQSELVKRIRGTSEPRMPLNQPPLSAEQIQRIANWIAGGAN